jgi:hypothetical protein
MTNNNFIKTLDFGFVPIRKTHKEGRLLANIELTDGNAEVRADYKTEQPFAVLFDDNWNEI